MVHAVKKGKPLSKLKLFHRENKQRVLFEFGVYLSSTPHHQQSTYHTAASGITKYLTNRVPIPFGRGSSRKSAGHFNVQGLLLLGLLISQKYAEQ